jgi:hypothetical protein
MTPEDPSAWAQALTRRAPWDVQQWLDGLHNDPNVTDRQYVEAQAPTNSAIRSDATERLRAGVGHHLGNHLGDDAGDDELDGWG